MLTKHIFNMPIEQSDNTRVIRQPIIKPIQVNPIVERIQVYAPQNQAQLWDADKVKRYENMQNFYNTNFFGYGIGGDRLTMIQEHLKVKKLYKLTLIIQKETLVTLLKLQ